MIEAMACGTPTLAFNRGSVPEIIENGKTGIIVSSADEAIKKLPQLLSLDRRIIRQEFERRFSAKRVAQDHIALYDELVRGEHECVQSDFPSDVLGNAEQTDQPTSSIQ
jgi:glycosyltransferase involved in cell wall biosynthesis